ncbi:hypothetical protein [Bacillus thuringiensis]|uniref:hypothetical protein n=1 Tax=Bacillus thuringiensis TaxID=1428 RepID=UPI003D9FE9FA
MNDIDMNFICVICGFDDLLDPPYEEGYPSYEICPCCGFQFGFDDCDQGCTFVAHREKWLEKGAVWHNNTEKPTEWSLEKQLKNIE